MKHKLLIICGPTATGKTALAATLARKFDGELISADSRQCYRGMDLVTGKDRPDVPIWLYDVVDPGKPFSVSQWVKLARKAIADIEKRKKLPIVVGGTGLYIKALLDPFDTIDIPPDEGLRKKLALLSLSELQELTVRDQMNDSDWNNPRRLIRKIEIVNSKRSHLARQGETLRKEDILTIGLTAPIADLDRLIDKRLEKRIHMGLQKEVEVLLVRYDKNLPSMSAIGVNEHAYAKRQMTWFRKIPGISWVDVTLPDFEKEVTRKVLAWYTQKEET